MSTLIAGLSDKEREYFLSALASSGDSARKLIITTDRLQGKEREAFLTFADSLSTEGLQDFLTAINNSPKDLENIMETASNLSEKDLDNYLSAAAMAGEDIEILNKEVNNRLDPSGKTAEKKLSGFLSAAAKSGRDLMDVIEKTQEVSKESADKILAFIAGQKPGEDMDNFFLMMGDASEAAINTIIDISPELNGQDQKSLLKTASRLGDNLDRFTETISTLAPASPGSNTADLSNFITTAGNAGKQMETLLVLSDRIDLGTTSQLSAVDTANFLVAADKAGAQAKPDVLDDLTDFVKELTTKRLVAENDKGLKALFPNLYYNKIERMKSMRFNFLKAASKAGPNLKGLIHMGRNLILEGNNKPNLTKVLNSAAVSETYLGSIIRTYA